MNAITVRCEPSLGAPPHFTAGRLYRATRHVNALYEIRDDLGRSRLIIPDEPSPHLPPQGMKYFASDALGRFTTVTE